MAYNEQDMQKLLDTLHNWCNSWRVLINTAKSKVIHFRLGENILETTDRYKYLGLIFSERKDFATNAENLAKGGAEPSDLTYQSYIHWKRMDSTPIKNFLTSAWYQY